MAVSFNGESHLISFYAAKDGVAVPAADDYVPTSVAHIRSLMSGAEQTRNRSTPASDEATPQQPEDDVPLVKARDQHTTLASQTNRPRRHTASLHDEIVDDNAPEWAKLLCSGHALGSPGEWLRRTPGLLGDAAGILLWK